MSASHHGLKSEATVLEMMLLDPDVIREFQQERPAPHHQRSREPLPVAAKDVGHLVRVALVRTRLRAECSR